MCSIGRIRVGLVEVAHARFRSIAEQDASLTRQLFKGNGDKRPCPFLSAEKPTSWKQICAGGRCLPSQRNSLKYQAEPANKGTALGTATRRTYSADDEHLGGEAIAVPARQLFFTRGSCVFAHITRWRLEGRTALVGSHAARGGKAR